MWTKGAMRIEGTEVLFWIKHFEEPSVDYGIDGGRISKLTLKQGGTYTANYDRGWDIEPEDRASQLAFAILMQKYN